MPWELRRNRLPKWHDHPLKVPKKVRLALAPLALVARRQWGALPNNDEFPMDMPIRYVRHVHTATDPCTTREECTRMVRDFQTQHMREGLADINWNFIIGGDGRVYEGRGWDLDAERDYETWQQVEAECLDVAYVGTFQREGLYLPTCTRGGGGTWDAERDYEKWQQVEAECLDVAYVGTFQREGEDIPEIMKKQAEALIYYGVDNKHLDCCYKNIPFNTELME